MKTVYFFTRKGCSACQASYPGWNKVVEEVTQFDYEMIDCDENLEFARAHEVLTLPTFLVVDEEGQELARIETFQNYEALRGFLDIVDF